MGHLLTSLLFHLAVIPGWGMRSTLSRVFPESSTACGASEPVRIARHENRHHRGCGVEALTELVPLCHPMVSSSHVTVEKGGGGFNQLCVLCAGTAGLLSNFTWHRHHCLSVSPEMPLAGSLSRRETPSRLPAQIDPITAARAE